MHQLEGGSEVGVAEGEALPHEQPTISLRLVQGGVASLSASLELEEGTKRDRADP